MAKYLAKVNYVGAGVAGLLKEGGSRRREAANETIASVGGSIESMYYAFGDVDVYVIVDFPDTASAAALSLLLNASGAVTVTLVPLMTPEEIDEASKKNPSYRPPGQ